MLTGKIAENGPGGNERKSILGVMVAENGTIGNKSKFIPIIGVMSGSQLRKPHTNVQFRVDLNTNSDSATSIIITIIEYEVTVLGVYRCAPIVARCLIVFQQIHHH
mmetsp:Transcript_33073/g.54078  ORF Transcript_33073/g.54078 Transcript_33073/m.54078 type:complete len:106 (+) Transcript_33073:377-694(+)